MSEQYSRLFALPTDLQIPGSPVLICAGILARVNQTGNVLVQLKFRNICDKTIKSVNVKINAFDGSNHFLSGVDSYIYSDLNLEPNGEFGTSVLIPLPDKTTKSFSVEILGVDFVQNEGYAPAAPMSPAQKMQETAPPKETKKAPKEKAPKDPVKVAKTASIIIIVCSLLAVGCVTLCFWHDIFGENGRGDGFGYWFSNLAYNSHRYLYSLIVPLLAIATALMSKKKPSLGKIALLVGAVFIGLQLFCAFLNLIFMSGDPSFGTRCFFHGLYDFAYGINWSSAVGDFFEELGDLFGWGFSFGDLWSAIWNLTLCNFGFLGNILPTAALLFFGRKLVVPEATEKNEASK